MTVSQVSQSQVPYVTAITQSVDELVRRVLAWLDDPQGGPVVPDGVSIQIEVASTTCREIGTACPESCVKLQAAVWRLQEEYRAYVEREFGKVRLENGAPGPMFWAAVKAVASARIDADQPLVERLEPVGVLLKQGVTHSQIGLYIYGRKGVGPFIQINGDVDVGLIEKEAATPGSVIPANWVPPWHVEALERRKATLRKQLEVFSKMETAKKYDDPATVEEMLRDGAYVQQIERAKGVTREEVLAAAQRIGIDAVDGPTYQPRQASSDDFAGLIGDDDDDSPDGPNDADKDALRDLIIEAYEKGQNQKGAAEISAELRAAGYEVTTRAVAAAIGHWKRKSQLQSQQLQSQQS